MLQSVCVWTHFSCAFQKASTSFSISPGTTQVMWMHGAPFWEDEGEVLG